MAKVDNKDHQSLPYAPHKGVIGCILDVSGSMQRTLEAGTVEKPALQRLQSSLQTVLKIAKIEQQKHPEVRLFVGLFGLDNDANPGCPTQIDLCSVIEALLSSHSDGQSGHDLLAGLAKRENRAHVERFIRTKLTDDEARFLCVNLQQSGRESRLNKFIAKIPSDEDIKKPGKVVRETVRSVGTASASVLSGFDGYQSPFTRPSMLLLDHSGGLTEQPSEPPRANSFVIQPHQGATQVITSFTSSIGGAGERVGNTAANLVDAAMHTTVNLGVEWSDALKLARKICISWLSDFTTFIPRSTGEIIDLLTRFQHCVDSHQGVDSSAVPITGFLDTIRRYLYGKTPMKHSLSQALEVFPQSDSSINEKHILLLISDGVSTDGDPLPMLNEALQKRSNIVVATVFLTSDRDAAKRRLYDEPLSKWANDGRTTLFNMASKVPAATHPIPVLTILDWVIPSSG